MTPKSCATHEVDGALAFRVDLPIAPPATPFSIPPAQLVRATAPLPPPPSLLLPLLPLLLLLRLPLLAGAEP